MAEYWFAYRDIADAPRKQFERLTVAAGALVVRDQVFPGMFSMPDIHIKQHRCLVGQDIVNLITYTEAPVSILEAHKLAERALEGIREEKP